MGLCFKTRKIPGKPGQVGHSASCLPLSLKDPRQPALGRDVPQTRPRSGRLEARSSLIFLTNSGHFLLGALLLKFEGGVVTALLDVLARGCLVQLLQDGLCDGHHHGRGGRVADPHGQEGCDHHEAQHQPRNGRTDIVVFQGPCRDWMPRRPLALGSPALACGNSQSRPHPDDEEHAEGDALVQIPMLDGNGHQQSPDEQDVGVVKVLDADLVGRDS